MNDDRRDVNPHTGQPIPDEPFAPEPADVAGAGAAFAADQRNEPAEPGARAAHGAGGASGSGAGGSASGSGSGTSTPAAAPSQQEIAVRAALETVMDPEIALSVIDLGLIREVHFLTDPPKTLVRMMLTTPFCPYAPQLIEDVKQATSSVVPQPVEVEIMPDPWSPDLMPDPGLLGYSF
jgi:metal-sulfur cluster biosynthetic enzyme